MALKLEGGLLGVIKALISRPDQDLAAPVWLSNLGKVNNILVPTFPSCIRKGMLFPCCRGTLEIELLSGGESRKMCVWIGFAAHATVPDFPGSTWS